MTEPRDQRMPDVEIRPHASVNVYGGATWSVLEEYDDIRERIRAAYQGEDGEERLNGPPVGIELTAWDAGGDHFRMSLSPGMIVGFQEISARRWELIKASIAQAEAQARAQADQMRGPPRLSVPGP